MTTYSSRGPTRFDLAVKPDVVAPGNKVVSLESSGAYLPTAYPTTHVAGNGTNAYMRMSGSSMATGVVAGGVALIGLLSPTRCSGPSSSDANHIIWGDATAAEE